MEYVENMSKDESKAEAVTKKLKSERNKYFVPEFGQVEADDIADVAAEVEKLKKKREEDKKDADV